MSGMIFVPVYVHILRWFDFWGTNIVTRHVEPKCFRTVNNSEKNPFLPAQNKLITPGPVCLVPGFFGWGGFLLPPPSALSVIYII